MHELDTLRCRIAELETAEADHKRVEEELEQRAALAELTHDVALRRSDTLEPNELFSTIVTAVSEALGYCSVALLLVDETRGQLTLQAVAGNLAEVVPEDLRIPIGEGMVGYAAQSGESQVSGNVEQHPYYTRKVDGSAKSELAVPIRRGKDVVGVLDIQSEAFDAFDEVAVGAMETLSTQIASSIENARLYEEAQRQMREMQLLHDVSVAASSGVQLRETLQAVVEAVAAQLELPLVGIEMLDQESRALRIEAAVGYPSNMSIDTLQPLGEGIAGWVVQHGEPLLVPDVRLDPRYIDTVSDTRSELCVPLIADSQVIGVLNVESPRPNVFTDTDLRLLNMLASNLSVLVERAHLLEETQDRAKRLAIVNRVAKAAGASLQLDRLMEIVYEEIASVFENDALYITLYDEQAKEMEFLFGVEHGERLIPERIPSL